MWIDDTWIAPDASRYALEAQCKADGATILEASVIAKKLLNEFRVPRGQLLELIQMISPVDNGYHLIRIGANGDGGYLVPNDLLSIGACFSPGVQHISDFEMQLASDYGICSYLLDGSIERPRILPRFSDRLFFEKGWLAAYTDLEADIPVYSLNHWIGSSLSDEKSDIMLQIDIEGGEWEALLALDLKFQKRMRIIICEFGSLQYMSHKMGYKLMHRVFQKLCQTHDVVHLHPNNCCGKYEYYEGIQIPGLAEITFHRKDRRRLPRPLPLLDLSNPLDFDSVPGRQGLRLSAHWRSP